ncbi:hypothetical protein BGAL_0063g00270 [Botrytis galanthina]|uniref:Cytochrome P450 n=1 Tax=Botrytis galanthina TaxID=278940 RepID=A0A4S8REN7_9HELO|nr:hypothetical protein BGAL_0063g00270 [Botrytis galanthina]
MIAHLADPNSLETPLRSVSTHASTRAPFIFPPQKSEQTHSDAEPYRNLPGDHSALAFDVHLIPLFAYSQHLQSNLYFHARSAYPGPKLAGVSNIRYAYNRLTGKWPWKIEEVRKHYRMAGNIHSELRLYDPPVDYSWIDDVVRIAPSELVSLTPRAGRGKYRYRNLDDNRRSQPASQPKKEKKKKSFPDIHATHVKNLETLVKTDFEDLGKDGGIAFEINPITHRDVARKLSPAFSARNTKAKEAVLHKCIDVFVDKMKAMGGEKGVELREWADWLTMDVSADMTYNRQMNQMRDEPNASKNLINELRSSFENDNEITPDSVANMKYLHACLQETFRIHQNSSDGLPRMSPGAIVDGNYIPRGVICQTSHFAAARNPRYFADPLSYRPQRWLPSNHPEYDDRYQNDDPKAFLPFNQGPRMCPASTMAWTQMKLYLAKILWTFDVEAVPGQNLSFDRDFSVYTMWDKPRFWVRFVPVKREEE